MKYLLTQPQTCSEKPDHFISRSRRRSYTTKLAIISAWLAVFIPGHLFGWLVEQSFSAVLLVIAITSLVEPVGTSASNFIGRRNKILLSGLLLITTLYILSTIVTLATSSYEIGVREIIDLPRYIIIGAIFIIMGNANPDQIRIAAEKLILVSLLFSLTVLFLYLFDVPLLSEVVRMLYEDTKTAISFPYWVRLTPPFENPNFLAFYAILCFAYALFFSSGRRRLILVILALVVLVVTGSRSGWFTAALLIGGLHTRILLGVFSMRRSVWWQEMRFSVVFLMVIFFLLWLLYPYLQESDRVQMVITALMDGGIATERNVAGRLDMVTEAGKAFSQRPLFGWGPLKSGPLEIIDNQYFLLLARHGAVGGALIMSIMLYVFYGAIKSAASRTEKFGVALMWFAVAVMLLTGAFLSNFRLFVLFVFFVVASTGKKKTNDQW